MDNERLYTKSIPIDSIHVGERLRQLDEEGVRSLMDSIRDLGCLLQPITVTPNTGDLPYRLSAGLHRLEACKRLGWKEIPATITTLTGARAELIEVDENLMQTTLTPAERAIFTARRKELYEALHPETAAGAAQGEGMKRAAAAASEPDHQVGDEVPDTDAGPGRQVGDEIHNQTSTFSEDTAQKSGRSKRSIERDAERGEKISPDVLAAIKGTSLDSGKYLDKLKGLSHWDQQIQLKQWLADAEKSKSSHRKSSSKGGKSSSKGGSSKTPQAAKGTPDEKRSNELMKLHRAWSQNVLGIWNEASSLDARKDFVKRLADDLNATIHFAGETFAPPSRPSLNGGGGVSQEATKVN
jgi:ParB-like chromosome segregation protein Spo0J